MANEFSFLSSTKLLFGCGKLDSLHTLAMPGSRALVVISSGRSVQDNGSLGRCLSQLSDTGVSWSVYNGISANPTKEAVEAGARQAIAEKCDFVVALGGGSVLDAAKVIALNATNTGDLWQYAMSGTGGRVKPSRPSLPWIAMPTTAGTGSEVDAIGVISNLATREKLGIAADFARYAIVDPMLTLSVPAKYTALQGFDALFHSLEGHISNLANPMADMVQEKAITNIGRYLRRAFMDSNDIEARTMVSFASTMSGYSMVASSCTGEHAIEHALSAYHEQLPHGAGLIMICKAFFSKMIGKGVADGRFVEMARWLGRNGASKPQDFLDELDNLMRDCGVDKLKMSDYGIRPDEFDSMATNAITVMERCWCRDIEPLTHEEIVEILLESYR